MAGRPRTVQDRDVVAAVVRCIGRYGSDVMTLAHIGTEAGITAGALVQRYGTKRNLLLLTSRTSREALAAAVRTLDFDIDDPDTVTDRLLDLVIGDFADPDVVANNLSFLMLDMTDEEFRAEAVAYFAILRDAFRRVVVRRGMELRHAPAIAGIVVEAVQGTAIVWAVDRRGTLRERLRATLTAIIDRQPD